MTLSNSCNEKLYRILTNHSMYGDPPEYRIKLWAFMPKEDDDDAVISLSRAANRTISQIVEVTKANFKKSYGGAKLSAETIDIIDNLDAEDTPEPKNPYHVNLKFIDSISREILKPDDVIVEQVAMILAEKAVFEAGLKYKEQKYDEMQHYIKMVQEYTASTGQIR